MPRHRQRPAGWNFDRRVGAPGTDCRHGYTVGGSRNRNRQRVLRRDVGHFGHHPQADAALAEHDRREIQADAELFELDRRLAGRDRRAGGYRAAGIAVQDGKFAARQKRRRLAGNGGEIGLRKRVNDASLLHGLQRRRYGGAAERLTESGERVVVVEVDDRAAETEAAAQIDAELLDQVALDFSDRHLQHDLIAAAHDDRVDDFRAGADRLGRADIDQPRRNVEGLLRLRLARDEARQDHAVYADALDAHVGIREDLLDRGADAVEIARDGDIEAGQLLAFRIEEENVGLSDFVADHVSAARRADHRIGDPRVCNQNVLNVAGKIDHHRFSDAKRNRARPEVAGGDHDGLGLRLDGHFRRSRDAVRQRREQTGR
jgi:hypothetical protein